jgi:dipeptidyl aminopeptidase/acylaminoacyl peptidase
VVAFDFGSSGQLVYSALMTHSGERSGQLLREGFKVGNSNIFDVLNGDVDGRGAFDRANEAQWFIQALGAAATPARRIRVDGVDVDRAAPRFRTLYSPDGSLALIDHFPAEIPASWQRYTDTASVVRMAAYRTDPNAVQARQIKQLTVIDLASGRGRALWPAPTARRSPQAAWSPDGRAVLLGPVLLPLEEGKGDPEGLAGSAIAEVNVADGRFRKVTVPAPYAAEPPRSLRWSSATRIEIVQQTKVLRFRKSANQWKFEAAVPAPERAPAAPAVRMEWRQDLNTPPVLYAVAADGRAVAVLDPNPDLQRFALGRVEMIDWLDEQGRKLRGRFYHPVHETNERVPLVIQTHGYAPANEFSLYGYGRDGGIGLGPGFSTYAAQPLAGRDIAVLTVADPTTRASQEPEEQMSAYESAVKYLAQRGLVDPDRVGLSGFSRTGWHVLHAVTHSKFPYAAALVSDNIDGGYFQAALTGWTPATATDIGAEPFGEGLQTWFARSPGFNVDRLSAPLRMQIESGGRPMILAAWEVYSRALRLGKNVELYVIPDVEHGSHGIQDPAQCLASQQGAVDWFDSWLRRSKH